MSNGECLGAKLTLSPTVMSANQSLLVAICPSLPSRIDFPLTVKWNNVHTHTHTHTHRKTQTHFCLHAYIENKRQPLYS